jgi:YfiH family protein
MSKPNETERFIMDVKNAKNGVTYVTSRRLGTPNAFFTKCGGVSEKYGLNLAYKPEDGLEVFEKNMKLAAEAVGYDEKKVLSWAQIHSARILTVKAAEGGLEHIKNTEFPDGYFADGYVTDVPGVVLGVKTADCVPVLLSAKRDGKVFAVGAVHAGWRGTAGRICENAVNALCELGAEPKNIFVAIGPSAMQCCYEVGDDVLNAMREAIGERAERYFSGGREGKHFVDLKGINASILYECGVPYENMDISELCTICEPRYFYSHRRDGNDRGTHLNVIFMD